MNMDLKMKFIKYWGKYFALSELPVTFYYTDLESSIEQVKPPSEHQCFIGALLEVRKGTSLCFSVDSIGCAGGKKYLGFSRNLMPDFEYFLSCGIPGKLKDERYKKTPELVKKSLKMMPSLSAPGRFIIFKRWDMLDESDDPTVVIFSLPLIHFQACSHWRIMIRLNRTALSLLSEPDAAPL